MPDFDLETRLMARGARRVVGIDEVGRGPLAGPVVAAAVLLAHDAAPGGIRDSKTLSARVRERLAAEIAAVAQTGLGAASVAEIDRLGIAQATYLAMRRAVAHLPVPPDAALVDGKCLPALDCPAYAVVRGDGLSTSIAAASVVAKVMRDRIMVELAQRHPGYGWERNKGYGTPEHLAGLKRHGATTHHRRSFAPIRNIV